ncbi:MAG TPA: CHAP domain-containing protein [Fimbriimonadaceae bacterium]|nr:CHAP domain-containing protein [Fimbriimonadaceae bacterium]
MPTAIEIAQQIVDANLREHPPGSNRGPLIDRMLRSAGVEPGNPWCAAFVSWCFRQATGAKPAFNSAGSLTIRNWFNKEGRFSIDPQDLLGWRGALFGWTNPDCIHGHIGLVRARFTAEGKVVAIGTLEGNTNPGGSRNGDGAYALRRGVPIDGENRLWFLNTTGLPGGDGWNPRDLF